MKKLLFLVLFFCTTLCANAQTTYAVRVGGGLLNYLDETCPVATLNFSANIPIKRYGHWIFSPGVSVSSDLEGVDVHGNAQIGYKTPISNGIYSIIKGGLEAGLILDEDGEHAIVGPSVDLCFEIKHFVVGVDAYYSLADTSIWEDYYYDDYYYRYNSFGVNLTIGYKF